MLLKRVLKSGVIALVETYTHPRGYVRPSDHGFATDQLHLLGDVKKVGNDMRKAMKKHGGKQPYESSGVGATRSAAFGSAYEY